MKLMSGYVELKPGWVVLLPYPMTMMEMAKWRFDPVTVALVVGGTVLQAQAAKNQADTQEGIAKFNAQVKEQEAEQRRIAGKARADAIRKDTRRSLSRARTQTAKSGFTPEGSPLLKELEIAEVGALDALTERFNTEIGVQRSLQESVFQKKQAKSARRAGRLGVGQALFSGGTQLLSLRS